MINGWLQCHISKGICGKPHFMVVFIHATMSRVLIDLSQGFHSKPGKDHLQATNYRPISLNSCICKVLEKMVNMRYLESGNFLTPVQYGFRKMRSTIDALLSLDSSICAAFANHYLHVSVL